MTSTGRFAVIYQPPAGPPVPCGGAYGRLTRAKGRAEREARYRHLPSGPLRWHKQSREQWVLLAGTDRLGITVVDNAPDTPTGRRNPGPNRWTLREDHIIDWIAVEAAADAVRPVRLTPTERQLAAWRILNRGGGHQLIVRRLHVSGAKAVEMDASYRLAALLGLALLGAAPRGETVAYRSQAA
jgi:hypothetical protein